VQGIIAAIRSHAEALKAAKMHIFVRRGGPNYQRGLQLMRDLGTELGLPIKVI
jgi:ATP citrate (pro-S)-lyase